MILYQIIFMLLMPFVLFFGVVFSKKFRAYLLYRESNLPKSTNIKPIWIHASSGEFEHAKFLIKSLKEKYPLQKIVVSYSSPSYLKAIKDFKLIDTYFPLPMDLKAPTADIIKRVSPKIVLFSRTDLWPELISQLKNKKIPSMVFARMENSKASLGQCLLYPLTYKKVDHISFVSEEDKKSFIKKFKPSDLLSLSVDGDPRIEEVLYRALSSNDTPANNNKRLILGSVWSEGLKVISPGIIKSLEAGLLKSLIIAPHDPTPGNIKEIQKIFKPFKTSLYSEDSDLNSQVVIVDSTGVLFDLYAKAQVAFVGGSFKKKVHSVIEPLSHGLPVLVGPYIDNNTEAKAYSVKEHSFVQISKNSEDFTKNLENLLNLSENDLNSLKVSILNALSSSTGASKKITSLITKKTDLYS